MHSENMLPRDQIRNMRYRAWNLYRNNPQTRKMVKSLTSKVVGKNGQTPMSQATRPDGSAWTEFRERAGQLWVEAGKEIDYRGRPGRGGQTLPALQRTSFRSAMLSGGCLFRFRHLKTKDWRRQRLEIPLQLQLVHIQRLDQSKGHGGIELDDDNRPKKYHLLQNDHTLESVPVSAKHIGHLLFEEDIDQILGASWFCATLLSADDRRDYENSEMVAAKVGSSYVIGYRASGSNSNPMGLPGTQENFELTDADGNTVTHVTPGMLLNLGQTGELQMINPNRPNSGAEPFLQYQLRGEASSVPGIKSSTVTGDYKGSSFSSERSADNDIWPEIEVIQEWFGQNFNQPVYEEVVNAGVLAGYFDEVDGFDMDDFRDRSKQLLKVEWKGPVSRSINPKDDEAAADNRVRGGRSSPQREAARVGSDWREIQSEQAEYLEEGRSKNLPDELLMRGLGLEAADASVQVQKAQLEQQNAQEEDVDDDTMLEDQLEEDTVLA
tara:strand:+ start:30 stop:1511 length:1482 start_codon:yes stop_codon:yes gene_type:complete